jgi:hypothetical protein
MGKIIAPQHIELIGIINKQLLLHLVGCSSLLFIVKNVFINKTEEAL